MLSAHPFDLLSVRTILGCTVGTYKGRRVPLRRTRVAVFVKSVFARDAIGAFFAVPVFVAEMTSCAAVVVPTFVVSKLAVVVIQWEITSTHSTRAVNAVTAGLAFATALAGSACGAELSAEAL